MKTPKLVLMLAIPGSLLAVVGCNSRSSVPKGADNAASAPTTPAAKNDPWFVAETNDKMDNTRVVAVTTSSPDGAALTIRCKEGATDAIVNVKTVVDSTEGLSDVRIRLDDSPPQPQSWTLSTNDEALFAFDPIHFSRQLENAHSLLFEFTPFREGPRTMEFNVSGLTSHLQKVADACSWKTAEARDNALRDKVGRAVHHCKEFKQFKEMWCWSVPGDPLWRWEGNPSPTSEGAFEKAYRVMEADFKIPDRKLKGPDPQKVQ